MPEPEPSIVTARTNKVSFAPGWIILALIALPRLSVDVLGFVYVQGNPKARQEIARNLWDIDPQFFLIQGLVPWIVFLGLAWFVLAYAYRNSAADIFAIRLEDRMIGSVVAGLVGTCAVIGLSIYFQPPIQSGSPMEAMLKNDAIRVSLFVQALFVAPFAEEFYFRGAIYGMLDRLAGPVAAIVGVTIWFGIIHLGQHTGAHGVNFKAVGYIMSAGLVWTLLRWRTGSTIPGVFCHFAYNAIQIILDA